jgi:hypothetical protein
MKFLPGVSLVLAAGLLVGCGGPILVVSRARTSPVSNASDENLPGVPFYVKTAGCKHETVWLQPVYSLTLKKTFTPLHPPKNPDDPQPTITVSTVTLSLDQYRSDDVGSLRGLLAAIGEAEISPDRIAPIEQAWNKVQHLQTGDPYAVDENNLSASKRVVRASNEITPETYVDYSTTYYYNSKKPLAGTSQATVQLAADGTLTQASAQVETKTLETFLNLLPTQAVLTQVAKAYLPPPLSLVAQPPQGTYKFELISTAKIFRHTHYAMVKNTSNGELLTPPCPEPTGDVAAPYNVTIEEVTTPPREASHGQTVKVNGSIQLPEPNEKKK